MGSALRVSLLVAVIAACLGAAYGAYALAGISWSAVVDYRTPYLETPLPPAPAAAPVADRTVLVIIDGLTLDASRSMGTLNALRQGGADLEVIAPQPTLSYPNWTTILTGAPPYVHGVVTNWHEGPALAETIFDTAAGADVVTAFVGPEDFEPLYGVAGKLDDTYMEPWSKEYRSARYVDEALRIARETDPSLMVIHLPDTDEAGHDYGAAASGYLETVARVDADLGRLVDGLQDGATVFAIVSDHGHIGTGGHGGWERSVVRVPAVFAGPGVGMGEGEGRLEDVAPTVAALAGIGMPRHALGEVNEYVFRDREFAAVRNSANAIRALRSSMAATIARPLESQGPAIVPAGAQDTARTQALLDTAVADRERHDRLQRLLPASVLAVLSVLAVVLVAAGSRQAVAAAGAGTVAYYAVYNALFFLAHGNHWSLSAFNSEDRIEAWMNLRFIEAAGAALVAVAVAGVIYPFLRREPKGARGRYLIGWLTLGPATVLTVLATLGLQVAWFIWWWGHLPEWRLPDLMWGFKYDLDLIQATAVGAIALIAPVVSFLVGRYHPRVRPERGGGQSAAGAPVVDDPLAPAGVGAACAEE